MGILGIKIRTLSGALLLLFITNTLGVPTSNVLGSLLINYFLRQICINTSITMKYFSQKHIKSPIVLATCNMNMILIQSLGANFVYPSNVLLQQSIWVYQINCFPTRPVYISGIVLLRKRSCLRRKTNGLMYPYEVVVAKHSLDIPSWPPDIVFFSKIQHMIDDHKPMLHGILVNQYFF